MKEGWVCMDRAMFGLARKRAAGYAQTRMGEGVEAGRTTADAKGPLWESLGRRALEMAQPEASKGGVCQKPEWEDVEAHNEGGHDHGAQV